MSPANARKAGRAAPARGKRRTAPLDLVLAILSAAVFAYLYLPVLVVILLSFNDSDLAVLPLRGLTLRWFGVLFQDRQVMAGLGNSVLLGLATAAIALPLGVTLSYAMVRQSGRARGALASIVVLPMQTPRIILGVLLLILFSAVGIPLSLFTVLLGHVVVALPFVTLIVAARLRNIDRALEEAARDLGASGFQIWLRILIPLLAPALLAAVLIAFTTSFDEMVVSYFTIGTESTLPVLIWSMVRYGYTQEINAIGALIITSTLVLALAAQLLQAGRRSLRS